MSSQSNSTDYDFKGLGFSKIGYFKEVRSKIKELELLNIELARRHNKLEAIINSMSSGLAILDNKLTIVFANQLQMSMFPEVSLVGQQCHKAFFRRVKTCKDCPALKTLESQETYRGEILIRGGAFAGRWYEWTTSPIMSPGGEVSEIVLLMRDITRRKEAEFKLLQADRMAAIGLLAAGIAHEINNPLTSIAGFSEGLLRRLSHLPGPGKDKRLESFREYLEIIFNEAYRCKDIIQNLLEYSRKSTDDTDVLRVDQIIKDTVSLVRQHAKNHKIRIIVKNGLAKGFNRVAGNESELKHLFLNVFNHAFRSMEGGGHLTIVSRTSGNMIEIDVHAQVSRGSASSREKIPDPSCSDIPSQTGEPMALSVCYSIMRHHRGDLRLESRASGEYSLVLRFPAAVN
ncbi:MAG: PAS domain-containing protein [Deltaproteobacteria bacterium]|nr:PAS domain-containing protein [Deltaproteobacteria bacterium]